MSNEHKKVCPERCQECTMGNKGLMGHHNYYICGSRINDDGEFIQGDWCKVVSKLRNERNALTAKNNELTTENSALRATFEAMNSKLEAAEAEIAICRERCEACTHSHDNAKLEAEIAKLKTKHRCRVREEWDTAGREGLFISEFIPDNPRGQQNWTTILWDGDLEPSLFKSAGLVYAKDTQNE